MEKRQKENGRVSSASSLTRPKSSCGTKKSKNGIKKNNADVQTQFALDIQSINPEIRAIMKKKPPMAEQTVELFESIRNGEHLKVKKMVKSKDCDTNARDVDDPLFPTPLIVAAEQNDTEMVKILVTAKHRPANVNDENLHGRRPVWIAARHRNTEMLESLLEGKQECQVNFVDRQTGTTPLYEAVLGNAVDVAKLLIHARADVNMRRLGQENGPDTPLTKAIQLDNKEMVQTLLNSLAKLQTKAENGITALHYAVAYRRYDICEILLEHGAKIHARTNSGVTSLAIAIENHNPAMVRILLDYGYKMDKRYKWKETPLQQAISVHAEDCAMTLLHFGCSLKKDKGLSYFSMAVNEKLIKLVKFMIALRPSFLNEDWIQKEEWPVSIYHRPDIFQWLQRESRKVRSLMFHCRLQIFQYLGRYPKNKTQELPIPEKLREYLQYNEFIKDKYYVKRPLDVRECPYDCPSLCSVPYCPPIEVSSSESDSESADEMDTECENESDVHSVQKSDHNSQKPEHVDLNSQVCVDSKVTINAYKKSIMSEEADKKSNLKQKSLQSTKLEVPKQLEGSHHNGHICLHKENTNNFKSVKFNQ